ncbi:MAG: adenosine deaminase [Legionellaceae bacterium]|nr:adenosine deaminase [Legionellaceae bacterium]
MKRICIFLSCLNFSVWATPPSISTPHLPQNPRLLYTLLEKMPKGGDLHYHLMGGASAEAMIAAGKDGDFCIHTDTFSADHAHPCPGILLSELPKHPKLYEKTIEAWTLKNFHAQQETAHDHFFASFFKIFALVNEHRAELLAQVMRNAAQQHILYLEPMILPSTPIQTSQVVHTNSPADFKENTKRLLQDPLFQKSIQETAQEMNSILPEARKILGCDSPHPDLACQVQVRFQYHALREQHLQTLFPQLLLGFALANQDPEIAGINFVQAEDGPISLSDYTEHMQLFNFLHAQYPSVHIALHAGELTPELVNAKDLQFHIEEAVNIGHAERIGHGSDIMLEKQAEQLAQQMAEKNIAVEVLFSSNRILLNLDEHTHPLSFYLKHHVPVVFSSDDEGILRTNLTQQYVDAVLHFGLDYAEIKQINRNSLTYSFLPGKSIWGNAEKAIPVKECQMLESAACQHFIQESPKAQLQYKLETELSAFEQMEFSRKNVLSSKKLV